MIKPLKIAAKKHQTDVSASRRIKLAASSDPMSMTPIVRTSLAVETKNGAIVEMVYATTRPA
jgi:hypothetical protein